VSAIKNRCKLGIVLQRRRSVILIERQGCWHTPPLISALFQSTWPFWKPTAVSPAPFLLKLTQTPENIIREENLEKNYRTHPKLAHGVFAVVVVAERVEFVDVCCLTDISSFFANPFTCRRVQRRLFSQLLSSLLSPYGRFTINRTRNVRYALLSKCFGKNLLQYFLADNV